MSLSKYELIGSMIDYDKYELGNKQVKEFGHEYMGNIHMAFVSYTENRDMKNKKVDILIGCSTDNKYSLVDEME